MGDVTAVGPRTMDEGSGHKMVPMAPNMCITPCAPSPIPMPYPILVSSINKLDPGNEDTKVKGKKTCNGKGAWKGVTGNEAGTQKDIVSLTNKDHGFPFPVPAVTVHFEGMPVTVTGNPGLGNTMS